MVTKAIAFFSDRCMLPGLHAAIVSLLDSLQNTHDTDIGIYVFLNRVSDKEKALIRETHQSIDSNSHLVIQDYSPLRLEGGINLHGSPTAYGRLYLASLLPSHDHCIYMDCDVITNKSIMRLFELFDNEHVLLADGECKREYDLHCDLYRMACLDMMGLCFNSGILGIDLKLWRKNNILERCREVAARYRGHFRSADQAILNIALHDSFIPIGETWNTPLYPFSDRISETEPCIYHFVGSPKPWDFFGKFINNNYPLWYSYYQKSALGNRAPSRYMSLNRSFRIFRQTLRIFWRKQKAIQ